VIRVWLDKCTLSVCSIVPVVLSTTFLLILHQAANYYRKAIFSRYRIHRNVPHLY